MQVMALAGCCGACAHFSRSFWGKRGTSTLHPVISGFFIYYAVSYYIKSCLLLFCVFFFSLHPTSSLLVLSLIGRIIRKEFSRESFHLPLIFPHTHIRAERFSGNLCLQFPVDLF